jgi:hypothetical protein
MRRLRTLKVLLTGVLLSLVVLSLAPAGASSANISHSYHGVGSIPNGSIVSLDPQRSDYVQPANTSNGVRLLGVAVNGDDSLLAVDATPGLIQVATSGTATVLLSTLNGNINVGDPVSVSPFNGVGMKAEDGARTIGLAQTSFNRGTGGATFENVKDKKGKDTQIAVGLARLTISIGTDNTNATTQNLNGLQRFARSITGHTVSTLRVAISLIIVSVSLLALITLVYASIYGSIISVGRNPLAKYAVFRTLGTVLSMAALTTLVTAVTVYLLLK